jgi:hypothetical protein
MLLKEELTESPPTPVNSTKIPTTNPINVISGLIILPSNQYSQLKLR